MSHQLNKGNNPFVDEWTPDQTQIIFTNAKNMIICNLADFFHMEDNKNASNFINCFMVNVKKSYNSDDLRQHYCHYLNYFEAYYDTDYEYFTNIANIKFCIDCYQEYKEPQIIQDIQRYILNDSIVNKVGNMVEDNYNLKLSYKSMNTPQLQYTDAHAKILMNVSILMNMCIPLITHFIYMRRLKNIDDFVLDIFDMILYHPKFEAVDIVSKLYQTTISTVNKNVKNNAPIWAATKQDIRGKDNVTHAQGSIRNIILNIMPKYIFSQSMVNLNYTSNQKNLKYQVKR